MGLRLSEKFGVNPVLTYCPRCGGETSELILAGACSVYQCDACKQKIVGKRPKECPKCHVKGDGYFRRLGEFDGSHDKLPATEPCEKCKEEIAQHKKIVADGGILWRCRDCNSEGVIRYSELAHDVRVALKIPPPAPCGVEFSKATGCPVCGQDAVKSP